jgi:Sulfotransferase family
MWRLTKEGSSPRYSRSPVNGIAKVPRFVRARSLWALNSVLDRTETATADAGAEPLAHPPIFIVGPPRTGSTLLYQLVAARFNVGYISNRHCRLYGAPSRVERRTETQPTLELTSRYGRTTSPNSPSECAEYWYRFFRRSPQYVPRAEMPDHQSRRLRASVRALGDAAGLPLVFKNLICAARLEPIAGALPEAVFVRIRRDLLATATSLLAGRKALFGDYRHWWSTEPPEIDRLRALPPEEQVVEQVRAVDALIDRAREELGPNRFCELTYESLCEDAPAALARIAKLAEQNGFHLTPRMEIPSRFDRSTPDPIDPDLHERLVAYIHRD